MESIDFGSGGETLRGNLHLPDGTPKGTVVLTGPVTSVKEQVTGTYASALAARGFAALAFDHRHFGESGGEPRQYESPARKIEDVSAAIDALGAREDLAGLPVHGLGICAGGGYMAGAAMEEGRIARFAGVAGFYAEAASGEAAERTIAEAEAARAAFARGEPAPRIPAVAPDGERAMPLDDALAYYGDPARGAVPNYTNSYALQSKADTARFDVLGRADRLRQPALIVHSEGALAPAYARRFVAGLPDARELWIDSADRQTAFYDDPDTVARAADAVADHFSR